MDRRQSGCDQHRKADFRDVVDDIKKVDPISGDVAKDVIAKLWRKEIGREITNLGINLSEGDASAMGLLQALLDRCASDYAPDDFGPTTTAKDLTELLAKSSNDQRWQFHIETLSRQLYGIGAGEFMIVWHVPRQVRPHFWCR